MNRLFLSMPEFVIKNYVNQHFNELSEEEGLFLLNRGFKFADYIIKTNPVFCGSKEILKKVIQEQPECIGCFEPSIVDEEIVDMIAKKGYKPTFEDVAKFPILLTNHDIKEHAVADNQRAFDLLSSDQIDDDIVKIIEEGWYCPTGQDIIDHPILKTSNILLRRAVKKDPQAILLIEYDYLDDAIVEDATNAGFVPTKEDFIKRRDFVYYSDLVEKGLEKDPSSIAIFYPGELDDYYANMAVQYGYIPTEQELISNLGLCNKHAVIEKAIRTNPSLIKYAINPASGALINEALNLGYIPTEQDIIDHPELCNHEVLIKKLAETDEKYLKYYKYLYKEQKIMYIKEALLEKGVSGLSELPFLKHKFGGTLDENKINELVSSLWLEIDSNNPTEQESYYTLLDQVIDGVINIKYEKQKNRFKYPSINSISDVVNATFKAIKDKDIEEEVSNLTLELSSFVNGEADNTFIDKEYLYNKLMTLYEIYAKKKHLSQEDTASLYNEILNKHADAFKSHKKQVMFNEVLKSKFSLTPKKQANILMGRKIEKISALIRNNEFEKLGISEEELTIKVKSLRSYISNLKDIRKQNIIISDEIFDEFEYLFFTNTLTEEKVIQLIGVVDQKIVKQIIDKYNQIKMPFIDRVSLTEEEAKITDYYIYGLGFNYNNFLIGNKDHFANIIAKLVNEIDNDILDDILENKEDYKEILKIIPLVDIVPGFELKDLIDILCNYPRVKQRIIEVQKDKNHDINDNVSDIFANFDYLIKIANGYASSDDIGRAILGEEVIDKVHESNAQKYLDFYLKMYKVKETSIPKIMGETKNGTVFESGNNQDVKRLLVGRYCGGSCIDLLNSAGCETYKLCLLEDNADVIMFTDKRTGAFVARALLFRRGNVVQLAPIYDDGGYANGMYSEELLEDISSQILEKAKANGDNIEFVFITDCWTFKNDYPVVKDYNFTHRFPHADLDDKASLIGRKGVKKVKKSTNTSGIDFDAPQLATYIKPRSPIRNGKDVSDDEMSRLRALRIELEDNQELKEDLARAYEPFFNQEYKTTVVGQDWYIAVREDGTFEELVVPTNDERAITELNNAKQRLISEGLIKTGNTK